jgi:hypothetical protein
MRLITILKNSDSTKLYVRDLKPGMIVPVGSKTARVSKVTIMDGSDGEPMRLISNGVTAVARRIEFDDHEPVIVHPATVIGSS